VVGEIVGGSCDEGLTCIDPLYYSGPVVTNRERVSTFRPDKDIMDAMEALKERDGMPFSEQIRRALRAFLIEKDVLQKSERPRAATRKRS
jgi:hypothetical protein